jgi:hypothetical protein
VSARGARRGLVLLVLAGVAAVLLAPTVKRILGDLTLPLAYESVIRQAPSISTPRWSPR